MEKLEVGMLQCPRCKRFLFTREGHFYRNPDRPTGFSLLCKDCFKEDQHERITSMKAKEKRERNQRMKDYRNRLKQTIVDLAGGCCQRCGYNEFLGGFCFHHINPEEKELNFITRVSIEKAKAEADKCILLCHTCHKTYHYGDWTVEFIKRTGIGWTIKDSKNLP